MAISDRLLDALNNSAEPIAKIAEQSGVPGPTLYRFIRGTRGLSGDTMDKLADYFELQLVPKDK